MGTKLYGFSLVLALVVGANVSWAEEAPVIDDEVNPKDWGIQNDCIRTNRIRSVKFVDNQTALIEISHRKTILMTLKRPCPGIKSNGFVYKVQSSTLCARMDYLRVIGVGASCQIERFEPYLQLDNATATDKRD